MTISVGNLIVAGGATVDTSEVLSALNKQGLKVWVGTTSQRDALPENVKNDDKITFLTYDSEEDIYLIVDTIISYSKTWSSVKISTELAKKINSSDVYTKTEVMSLINSKVASALKYRGAVATVAALPSSGQENGDSYYVQADGYMYAWSSDYSDWQALGSATDMTNYYTKTEVDALLADMAVKFQYNVMPTADSTTVGQIIQYTGADTNDYKNGYWYKGVDNGDSTYDWTVYTDDKYALSAYSNDLQLTYEGASYATTSALLTQLTSDIVARKHSAGTVGGNIAITWTGKSCVTGNYSIHSSGAGFVVLDFENAQDGNKHCVYYISNGSATGITWSNLATTDGTAMKYNYTMTGTASLEDDIKAFVTALLALGANTYVGFFNRSGNLGTAGNYSITVYAESGTSTFASGYITLGAGALGKTQYIVSYYKPTGSSEEWTIKKLAMENDIVTRHNYSVQGTTDAIADTKALVNHIVTLPIGTYAGEFKRSGITFGSYRLTYFIDGIYAKSISGIVTYSISLNTDATYQVSYVEDIEHGTPPVWKIEKLVTEDNSVKILPSGTFADMNALLADIKARGTGFYKGMAYLSSSGSASWHDYDICITLGTNDYWYGIGNLRSERGVSYYVYKDYSSSDSWNIQQLATENTVAHRQDFWIWDNMLTYTLNFSELWSAMGVRSGAQLICYSTADDSLPPKLHIFAVAATAISEGSISVTDIGGDAGFSATVSGASLTITAPEHYNTAKLLY